MSDYDYDYYYDYEHYYEIWNEETRKYTAPPHQRKNNNNNCEIMDPFPSNASCKNKSVSPYSMANQRQQGAPRQQH